MPNVNVLPPDATYPPDAGKAILAYINDRLEEWAEWTRTGLRLGLGYPACSLEYRLLREGHVEKGYQGLVPIPEHPNAEEVDRLLCEMAAQNQKLVQAIKLYYLETGTIRQKSRKIRISHARFETYLTAARWWLAGRLAQKGKVKKLTQPFVRLQNQSRVPLDSLTPQDPLIFPTLRNGIRKCGSLPC